ncbi:MAG TPA: cytochrome c oxidase subunit 3, partial [Myxococcaceae bacterium]|nr:cytochrome c oxidase subunit 3 [Myxococcaceae bacterium]
ALLGAAVLGAAFLASQGALWHSLASQGLRAATGGPYASVFYGFTWVHAAHVLVGLGGLGRVAWQAFRGEFSAARFLPVRLWAMYWHFVGVIWGLMFVTVFVV